MQGIGFTYWETPLITPGSRGARGGERGKKALGSRVQQEMWAPPGQGRGSLLRSREREGKVGMALPAEGMTRQMP